MSQAEENSSSVPFLVISLNEFLCTPLFLMASNILIIFGRD